MIRFSTKQLPPVLTTLLATLLLAVFPIACDFTYSHITRSKWIIALCLGAVCFAGGLSLLVMQVLPHQKSADMAASSACKSWYQRLWVWFRNPAVWLTLCLFLWMGLSCLFGADRDLQLLYGPDLDLAAIDVGAEWHFVTWLGDGRYEGYSTQLCYLVICLAFTFCVPREKPLVTAVALGLTAFLAIVAMQYTGTNPLGLFPKGRSIYTNYEFQGTIGNIDMITAYLAIVVPLLIGFWVLHGGVLGGITLAAGVLGVLYQIMTDVQAGLLAIAGGAVLLVYATLIDWRRTKVTAPKGLRWRSIAALSGIILCFFLRRVFYLPWLDGDPTAERAALVLPGGLLPWAALLAAGLLAALSVWLIGCDSGGLHWKAVLALLLVLLVLALALTAFLPINERFGGLWELHEILNGRAQDSFGSWRWGIWRCTLDMSRENLLFGGGQDCFEDMMDTYLFEHDVTLGEHYDNPHNLFLTILANNGLPGMLLCIALLAYVITACLRRGGFGWAVAASLICYVIQGMFTFSICITSPMAWCVIGMAGAYSFKQSKKVQC